MTTFGFHLKNAGEEPGEDIMALINEILARLDGVSFMILSKEEYDSLEEKDPTKVYYVFNNNKVEQYMGEAKLSGASITAGSIIPNLRNHMQMKTGIITEE